MNRARRPWLSLPVLLLILTFSPALTPAPAQTPVPIFWPTRDALPGITFWPALNGTGRPAATAAPAAALTAPPQLMPAAVPTLEALLRQGQDLAPATANFNKVPEISVDAQLKNGSGNALRS